eukprot:scaffold129_cov254-Pinguiococcus_pyrenoidosus.AAC.7
MNTTAQNALLKHRNLVARLRQPSPRDTLALRYVLLGDCHPAEDTLCGSAVAQPSAAPMRMRSASHCSAAHYPRSLQACRSHTTRPKPT